MNPTSPLYMDWFGYDKAEVCIGCVLSGVDSDRKNRNALSAEYHWTCSEGMRLFPRLSWSRTSSGHCHWQNSHHDLLWRKRGFGCPLHLCNQGNGGSLSQLASETQHLVLSRTRDNGRNWHHTIWILKWTQRSIWYDSTLDRNWPHVLRYSSFGYSKAIAIVLRMVGPSVTVKLQVLCSSQ